MATDFGQDISCISDLDPTFAMVSGRTALVQSLARRFMTRRGSLWYALEEGLDLRDTLNESLSPADVQQLRKDIETECLKDERVAAARASVALNQTTHQMTVSVILRDGTGPFQLVLGVSAVSVTILNGGR